MHSTSQVEFVVDVVGAPPPDITWYKDGREIFDTNLYEFRQVGDRYSLVLLRCQLGDEGDMKVRAANRAGMASSQATFRVHGEQSILQAMGKKHSLKSGKSILQTIEKSIFQTIGKAFFEWW